MKAVNTISNNMGAVPVYGHTPPAEFSIVNKGVLPHTDGCIGTTRNGIWGAASSKGMMRAWAVRSNVMAPSSGSTDSLPTVGISETQSLEDGASLMVRRSNSEPSYRISETFLSVQGEGGPGLGSLAFFIRFQLCNLRCHFCDTKHTWTLISDPVKPENPCGPQEWRIVPHSRLVAEIEAQPARRLIFTGGEPLLTNFSPLVDELGARYVYEVETNGAIIPSARHGSSWICSVDTMIQWNVSPKYPFNSGQRLNRESLEWWAAQQNILKIFFKLVVLHSTRDEFDAQLAFVARFVEEHEIAKSNTLIMLEGTTLESQIADLPYKIGQIIAAGFNWSPRLHILVWHGERGK